MSVPENIVAVFRTEAEYGLSQTPEAAPELLGGVAAKVATIAVRQLFRLLELDRGRFGTPAWNPLGECVRPNGCIVIKPNLVLHFNQGGYGLECLVTHPDLIEAVLEYAALARPSRVVVGDAPVQGCDFTKLREALGLDAVIAKFQQRGLPVELLDFRRTVLPGRQLGDTRVEGARAIEKFVLFDLGKESLLEAIAGDSEKFRVTMYNPELLSTNHTKGRHRYLIAREIIDADLVINLPKLKSHKKSCITGALKNLIGINGNKEFLPHHRKGGSQSGGDCYSGGSKLKLAAEQLFDFANRRSPGKIQGFAARTAELFGRSAEAFGADNNLEGSWYGNDTIWRTCLDLQRILRYGRPDGSVSDAPQRVVLSVTDAIIGGQGEGPLANDPMPSGFVTAGFSTAAAEWVHARLMGFEGSLIPLTREAFGRFRYPLVSFAPEAVCARLAGGDVPAQNLFPFGAPFKPASGWRGHCELKEGHDSAVIEPAVVA